jgi:PAS domain S-box-containing protein
VAQTPHPRLRIARLIGLFALLSAVPLALLAGLSSRLAADAVRREVETTLRSATSLSAVAVEHELQGLAELVDSYGTRPTLVAAMLDSDHLDREAIRFHLRELQEARPGIATAFAVRTDGRLIDIVPPTPSIVGVDFSFRDWYLGLVGSGGPYVSAAYESAATGQPRVVAATVFVRTPSTPGAPARLLGILVAAYGLEAIQRQVEDFAASQGVELVVTDQRGVVIASPGVSPDDEVSLDDDPLVQAALDGRSGVTSRQGKDGSTLSAYAPVAGLGWAVVGGVPEAEAMAPVGRLRTTVLGLAAVLGAVLGAGLLLLAMVLRRLKTAEERRTELASIVDSSEDAIVGKDLDGRITSWNGAAERLYGYTASEAVGRPISLLVPPDRPDEIPRILELVGRGERVEHFETVRLRKDGRPVDVSVTVSPIRSADGAVIGASAISRDVTERRRAQQETERLRIFLDSVVENIPNMIFVKDAEQLRFVRFNRAGEELLGIPRSQLLGKSDHDLFPPEQADSFTAMDRQTLERGQLLDIPEEPIQTAEGSRILHTRKIPILDPEGRPAFLLGISEDITEVREAQEAVGRAQREAERANRAKSEFLSRMSHELRTPLNAILGFGQLLGMDDMTDEQRESVEQILKGGHHLLELINEVLDISRIETGQLALSIEPIPVDHILGEVLALVRPMAAGRGVDLSAESRSDDLHVVADQSRLKQVLLNLVSNAVKYGGPGARVTIRCQRRAGDRLRILVRDTGPGIPKDKMDRLFTAFDRLGAETSQEEGTGLGLALSRQLVEAMGGTIGAESRVGEGSTFWVELPLGEPEDEEAAQRDEDADASFVDSQGASVVLLIEDNPSNAKLIDRILAGRGRTRLITAMQGRMGLELAAQHRPDVILLDINLPDISGHEVLRRLRSDPRTEGIPVVMVSADATPHQVDRMLEAGARGYLTKPVDVRRLLSLLDEMTAPAAR